MCQFTGCGLNGDYDVIDIQHAKGISKQEKGITINMA
jgi:hypothetical protein